MNTKFTAKILLAQALSLLAIHAPAQTNAAYYLNWSAVAGGAGDCSGSTYTLSGVIGQPAAAASSGGSFSLTTGFWAADGPAPLILTAPQNYVVNAGSEVGFEVTAVGAQPLRYQWRLNGAPIPGATDSSYYIPNAQPANAGAYSVAVSNFAGAVTGLVATLAVDFALRASVIGGGTVGQWPEQNGYTPNSTVTLIALPVSGWAFSGWSGDASGLSNPLTVVMTSNKSITANFTSTVPDIIVDNPAATFTGNWHLAMGVGSELPPGPGGPYGGNFRFAQTTSNLNIFQNPPTATFTPNLPRAGRYEVYVWWPALGTNGSLNATYAVFSDGGALVGGARYLDQRSSSGGWLGLQPFGTRPQPGTLAMKFNQGTDAFVQISTYTGESGRYVAADAVRFAYSTNQDTPPLILSLTKAGEGMSVTFCGQANRYYQVQFNDDLATSQWTDLGQPIWASAPVMNFLDNTTAGVGCRFYRVALLP